MEYIGQNIRRLRTMRGITVQELSRLCDSNITTISLVETGKREPSVRLLVNIAKSLNVDISDLFSSRQYKHILRLNIKFTDNSNFFVGSSKSDMENFSYWGIIVSSELILQEIIFYEGNHTLPSFEIFYNNELMSFLTNQRLKNIVNCTDINNPYSKIEDTGVPWSDFKKIISSIIKETSLNTNDFKQFKAYSG